MSIVFCVTRRIHVDGALKRVPVAQGIGVEVRRIALQHEQLPPPAKFGGEGVVVAKPSVAHLRCATPVGGKLGHYTRGVTRAFNAFRDLLIRLVDREIHIDVVGERVGR